MTPTQRDYLAMERTRGYYVIMFTTIGALTAIAAMIHFGPQGYSAPLVTLVIAATAYGILAGGSALSDMINLSADMDDDMAKTAYGKGLQARNLGALKTASTVLLALVGLAELSAIFI